MKLPPFVVDLVLSEESVEDIPEAVIDKLADRVLAKVAERQAAARARNGFGPAPSGLGDTE